jgi:hypothetical protein
MIEKVNFSYHTPLHGHTGVREVSLCGIRGPPPTASVPRYPTGGGSFTV